MAEPILKLTRGVPKTDREWMDVFRNLTKFLRVSGNQLQIAGEIDLPALSVGTAELQADAVTNDKLRDSAACSVMGRSVNTGGNPADIIAGSNGHYLRRSGDSVAFGAIADADLPSTIARDTEVAAAVSAHEAAGDPHPQYQTEVEGDARYHRLALPVVLPSYTVGTLPDEATYVRGLIYVSDETGGAVPAFSDGTNWRRVTDRVIVS